MTKHSVTLIATFVAVLVLSALASYILFGRPDPPQPVAQPETVAQSTATVVTPTPQADAVNSLPARAEQPRDDASITEQIFGVSDTPSAPSAPARAEDWGALMLTVVERFALAAFLSALLAFRPRKYTLLFQRNPFVAQTEILLAVVASALMMIVGDSAARAFGIFAAASLVRFRTNIRDPKEITVLLICLAIGLGTGVGRWELALILTLFALALLWILEYHEPAQVFRTMELKVKTRSVDETHEALRDIFKKHRLSAEVRVLEREREANEGGCIVYYVDVGPLITTDQMSEEILSTDAQHIDSIEWDQKKKASYVYQ